MCVGRLVSAVNGRARSLRERFRKAAHKLNVADEETVDDVFPYACGLLYCTFGPVVLQIAFAAFTMALHGARLAIGVIVGGQNTQAFGMTVWILTLCVLLNLKRELDESKASLRAAEDALRLREKVTCTFVIAES